MLSELFEYLAILIVFYELYAAIKHADAVLSFEKNDFHHMQYPIGFIDDEQT